MEQVKAQFSWDGEGRRRSFRKGRQNELLLGCGVSREAARGASPGSPAGTAWWGERRSRPWKDGGVQNLFAFYFSTYSGIKSKHFIVSGTVRGHVLVCNRAALWSVAQLSPAFLQCLLPGPSAHLCPHTYLPKPLTALLWNYQQPSKPLVSRADSLLIFEPVWSSEPHQW